MASYLWRIAKITGWGRNEILYNLPFSVGLQIIHADDASRGLIKPWIHNRRGNKIDSLALIESAFSNG